MMVVQHHASPESPAVQAMPLVPLVPPVPSKVVSGTAALTPFPQHHMGGSLMFV